MITLPSEIQSFLLQDAEKRDILTARRANLVRVLLRERYLTRESLIQRVEYSLGSAVFGQKSWVDNFYRDMRVVKAALKKAGYILKYSRKKNSLGYYLEGKDHLGEKVKKEISGALYELDDAQLSSYKEMPVEQKFYQAVSIIDFGRQVRQRQVIHE